MKLRFLMSHCRKSSVRFKMVGKKWIFKEETHSTHRAWAISEGNRGFGRNTLHRQALEPSQTASAASKCGVVSFHGLGNFIG